MNVYMPKDRVTNLHQSYGFVEFRSEEDADYSIKILNMTKLYGKPIRVNKASQDKFAYDVGANLFIGNLDPDVDEKVRLWGPDFVLVYISEAGCTPMPCLGVNSDVLLSLLCLDGHHPSCCTPAAAARHLWRIWSGSGSPQGHAGP